LSDSNQADLKLLEDMGITPNASIRARRPTLKTVGLMVMFMTRTKKVAEEWKEKRKMMEQLAMKVEGMRRMKGVAQQKSSRRSLPLGTR